MPKDFKTLLKISNTSLPKEPSSISPETEIIRNIERALDGTACIDWVSEKVKLNVAWDMLNNVDYRKTIQIFSKSSVLSIETMAGIIAEAATIKNYYVDGITALPTIIGEEFYWQNVNITLLEV